ncbi:hypothetical protein [Comamonas odontotermitis]|uniref:hypothetical protein n=1 Tax=Comamonas odontotermitis TaxID=379895 RepID=UPI001CC652E0|nr:hypothetical protein [Comamonas odontotermitis]UBB16661.1 hypothetical protein LAD35_17995 [Comamonas odontotermitis]
MIDSLTQWAAPYGGALFVAMTALAVISLAALWHLRPRLSGQQLRRMMRVAALVALAGSWVAMQQGEQYLATALLILLWGILVGITCAREIARRR